MTVLQAIVAEVILFVNVYNANTGLITPPQKVGGYLLASFLDYP